MCACLCFIPLSYACDSGTSSLLSGYLAATLEDLPARVWIYPRHGLPGKNRRKLVRRLGYYLLLVRDFIPKTYRLLDGTLPNGLQISNLSTPSGPQPEPARPDPSQQMQTLMAKLEVLAEQDVRHSGDTTSSGSAEENGSDKACDDRDSAFVRHLPNAMKTNEERDASMGIEARKARERIGALVARETSAAKWASEAWEIRKDRDAQRARYKSLSRREAPLQETEDVPKVMCTNHKRHWNLVTADRGSNYPPHIRRGRCLARIPLLPSLQLFNCEDAEISLTLSEQRETAAWKPPFIPRSFKGLLSTLHSDAEHPEAKSDTTDFVTNGPNTHDDDLMDLLPGRFSSEHTNGPNTRPHFFDVVWSHFLFLVSIVH